MSHNVNVLIKHKEPLRNLGLVLSMVLMTFLVLTFLGVIHLEAPDFEGIRQAVTEHHDPAVMIEADETALRKQFGFNARDLGNFIYFQPKSSMDASEILVIQAKSQSEAQAMESIVDLRRTTNEATFRNYRPDQANILERSHLRTQGEYLIFISAENVTEIKAALDQAFR